MKYYECKKCGNVFEVIRDSAIVPMCCSESMTQIMPNIKEDVAKEKHIPVYKRNGNKIEVMIGSVPHPMSKDHYIEWIELETNTSVYRRNLKYTDKPCVTFYLSDDKEEVINIYTHCNIHGLWSIK